MAGIGVAVGRVLRELSIGQAVAIPAWPQSQQPRAAVASRPPQQARAGSAWPQAVPARSAGMPVATVLGAGPAFGAVRNETLARTPWPGRASPGVAPDDPLPVWSVTYPIPPRDGVAVGTPLPPGPPVMRPFVRH